MKWRIMVRGEDGIEFRYDESVHDNEAMALHSMAYLEAEEAYPDCGVFVTPLKDKAHYYHIYTERHNNDDIDLY